MIPFFTTSPTIKMIPINEDTLSGVPVTSRRKNTPISESGAAEMITIAGRNARNWITSTVNTAASAKASTETKSRNELCWISYCPPIS